MKKILAICVCCTVVLCFTFGTATAAAKIPIIFATSADSNPKAYSHMAYLKFAELANKYSDNAFDFKYFPNSQMGDEIETVRAIQLGTVHMSNLGTNNFAVYAPSVGWLNMPYFFETLEEFRSLVDAMWDKTNEWAIKEGGCRFLYIMEIGFRQLTTNAKYPVRTLADAKGVKIRVPQNALMVATFKALGLEPAAVAFAETFNALQQGVVDGQEGCLDNVITLKFYEAQKYVTKINWSVHNAGVIVSEQWLQSLSEKNREAIIRAGREAMEYERSQVARILKEGDEFLAANGIELLGEVTDMPEWVRLGRMAWPKCYEVIGGGDAAKGKEIVDLALSYKKK